MQHTITTAPVRLAGLVGIADDLLEAGGAPLLIWTGFLEVAGPGTVQIARSMTAPDTAAVIGSRMPPSTRRELKEYIHGTGDGVLGGPFWLWTTRGESQVWIEKA